MRRHAGVLLLCASLLPAQGFAEPSEPAGKLQLYVMPDTQSWAWNQGGDTLEAWRSVAKELCRKRERFAMVLHTGDLVDNHRLRPIEWSNALSVMQELDACRMPYAIAFGNHDFDNYPGAENVPLAGDQGWRKVIAKLAHKPAETGHSGRSFLHPLAKDWFILTVDFAPSLAELGWIAATLEKHRGARFVLLHHACVSTAGLVEAFPWCRQLVEQHRAIRIAVSGHWLGARRDGWKEVPRANAPSLVALYQNYQHVPALAPWGVVIELELATGAVCVWSENLLSGQVGHRDATGPEVGWVGASPARTCFAGS